MRTSIYTALFATALACSAPAQEAYSHNWQSLNFGFSGSLAFSGGDGLWGGLLPGATSPLYSGTIRICYGIDALQGGIHASGSSPLTWMMLVQAHSQGTGQNEAGLISLSTTTYDSAAGDACFTPLFLQTDPTSGAPLNRLSSTAAVFSGLPWGGAAPAPTFYFGYFQLFDNSGEPLDARNRLGTAPAGPFPGVNPLLGHLVLEIQGPANAGPQNIQYYLATTDEVVGPNGGVTNGNIKMGEGIFGLGYTADITGATVHSRLSTTSGGVLAGGTTLGLGGLGTDQWFGTVATGVPAVWSGNDPNGSGVLNTGGGGVDWSISQSVSTIQLRALDMLSGGQVAGTSIDPAGGPASNVSDASILASQAFFIFSNSEATGTFQAPCGWCDMGGTLPMEPGDISIGDLQTDREGPQRLPVCFDALTASFASQTSFSLGSGFRGAYDPNVDASLTGLASSGTTWAGESLTQAGVGLDLAGSSQMPSPLPISPAPNPALGSLKLCVTAALLEASVDSSSGALWLGVNEFANVASVLLH